MACQAITGDGGGVTIGSGLAGDPAVPEPASRYQPGKKAVSAKTYIVVTANIAQAIVDKIHAARSATGTPITPGLTTLADISGYQAKRRDAVCVSYRAYWVCGMPPPSSGGIAVASALGVLENFDLGAYKPVPDAEGGKPEVAGVHLVSEAERLAYADRDGLVPGCARWATRSTPRHCRAGSRR